LGYFYGFLRKKGLFLLKMGNFGQKCPQIIGGILRHFRPVLSLENKNVPKLRDIFKIIREIIYRA
jgi:hypothetical protein